MSALSIILGTLSILFFPLVQSRIFSLEWDEDRGENVFRWAQFVILFVFFLFSCTISWQNSDNFLYFLAWGIVFICSVEVVLRSSVRYVLSKFCGKQPFIEKVYRYITENPDNLYYSKYVPHPFLQFTGPRNPVEGKEGDYFLGFKDIKLSDQAKPAGCIRIACLGGSTTADGYPEFLQEYLTVQRPDKRFQVMNFGTTWWSSVHSTVNYVLNVIDYKADYLVVHDSCNDHHYRGFPGLRGDCAHAYRLFMIPQTAGEAFFRFSLIYRIVRILLNWKFPAMFRPHFEMKDIGLLPGKTFEYAPNELYIIDRNIETICTLARSQGSTVCLTTMPLSMEKIFSVEHDKVYRPHTRDVNDIIRRKAAKYRCLLADFDIAMTGKEVLFNDAVHSSVEGNRMKAELVGKVILSNL